MKKLLKGFIFVSERLKALHQACSIGWIFFTFFAVLTTFELFFHDFINEIETQGTNKNNIFVSIFYLNFT